MTPMTEEEWRQWRVVHERDALKVKADKLAKFIAESDIFRTLDPEEQSDLASQCYLMGQYLHILNRRIARFPK